MHVLTKCIRIELIMTQVGAIKSEGHEISQFYVRIMFVSCTLLVQFLEKKQQLKILSIVATSDAYWKGI